MATHQDKAATDVLDYQVPNQPESKRVKWLFRITIGAFLLFVVSSITILLMQQQLSQVYSSGYSPLFKIGFAASKLLVPLGLLLAIIGLHHRSRVAYYLVGAFIGLSIFNLFTRFYAYFTYGNQSITEVPNIRLIEFSVPIFLIAYLIYFYTNDEVVDLIGSSRINRAILILVGVFIAGMGYLATHSMG